MIGALAAAMLAFASVTGLSVKPPTVGQKTDTPTPAATAPAAPKNGGGNAAGGSPPANGKNGATPAAGGGAAAGGGTKPANPTPAKKPTTPAAGGGGGTTAGGVTKPKKPKAPKKATPTAPSGGNGNAGGSGSAGGNGNGAGNRTTTATSTTPTGASPTPQSGSGTPKSKPPATTASENSVVSVAGAGNDPSSGVAGSGGTNGAGTGAGADNATGAAKKPNTAPDPITKIVTRIVEVIPLWAKLLMVGLGALVVILAVGAHLRLRQRAGEYQHQALHDALTELPNRTYFVESVDDALDAARSDGSRIAVMLIDLDGFKEVNDTLGHTSGDRLLEKVATRLGRAVRDGDTVARLGGDEFAVLLPGVPDVAAAAAIGSKLLTALRGTYTVDDLSVHSDASIGIAIGPDHGDDADTLLRHADVAMYVAKGQHAGVSVYDIRRDRNSPERLAMIADLRRGIARREFGLFFQPQIEPHTGRVDGVEALVRWRHPQRGLIPPDDFVALAERTGVIRPLSLFVLETAIRECAGWLGAGVDMRVAVNLSAASLVDTQLPATVDRLLKEWQVPAHYLRLEITETTAMADPARTLAVLTRLDALGVALSIDDFGTGYSSLAYLRSLPVREIKIDRSFVMRMTTDPNDHAIVVATIDLGHDLGLRVVAEGVEDEATLRELGKKGCDLVQGFLFAKPMPAEELRIWLQGWPGTRSVQRGPTLPASAPEALPHSV